MMYAWKAFADRQTDEAIVITFQNWSEVLLYDSRKTMYDMPLALEDYPVRSINVVDNLTIIEI